MLENVKRILIKSKEENCDLSIAHAKVRNDDRLAGFTDHSELDKAYKIISDYEAVVTKMWREGNLEALAELCSLVKEGNTLAINKLIREWQ